MSSYFKIETNTLSFLAAHVFPRLSVLNPNAPKKEPVKVKEPESESDDDEDNGNGKERCVCRYICVNGYATHCHVMYVIFNTLVPIPPDAKKLELAPGAKDEKKEETEAVEEW